MKAARGDSAGIRVYNHATSPTRVAARRRRSIAGPAPGSLRGLGRWPGATFSTGSGYTLGGTIGRPDAGALSGSDTTLGGGTVELHRHGDGHR